MLTLRSYAECHDGVHNIVVVFFQGLDSLLSGDVGLSHNELDVLRLQTRVVNLFSIILLLVLLGLGLRGLALALVGVVVTSVGIGVAGSLGRSELLSGIDLRLRVQVLDLGLAEDAIRLSVMDHCEV